MSGAKRNPPFGLDMDFGEALERFILTDPQEAEKLQNEEAQQEKPMPTLQWSKNLSDTDAQRETSGGLVPYLRLTKSSLKTEDFQSWFRDTFFADAGWASGSFGRETDIETASVAMQVRVNGLNMGSKAFQVTHGPNRREKNNTPNTWVHWPPEIQSLLQSNDLSGHLITLKREPSGAYEMTIESPDADG